MFDKNTLKSLINKSKKLNSIIIPKQLTPSEKGKILDGFSKLVKARSNGREIVLVEIEI